MYTLNDTVFMSVYKFVFSIKNLKNIYLDKKFGCFWHIPLKILKSNKTTEHLFDQVGNHLNVGNDSLNVLLFLRKSSIEQIFTDLRKESFKIL